METKCGVIERKPNVELLSGNQMWSYSAETKCGMDVRTDMGIT